MTRLIGTTWKHSNVLSEGVLIARFLLGNLEIILPTQVGGEVRKILMLIYSSSLSWWFVAGVTPLPIPNREVKPCRTDDSSSGAKVGSCQDCGLEYIQNTKNHNFDLSLLWFFVWLVFKIFRYNKIMIDRVGYQERVAVRAVVIDDTGQKVLLFGDGLVGGGVEEGESEQEAHFTKSTFFSFID